MLHRGEPVPGLPGVLPQGRLRARVQQPDQYRYVENRAAIVWPTYHTFKIVAGVYIKPNMVVGGGVAGEEMKSEGTGRKKMKKREGRKK